MVVVFFFFGMIVLLLVVVVVMSVGSEVFIVVGLGDVFFVGLFCYMVLVIVWEL